MSGMWSLMSHGLVLAQDVAEVAEEGVLSHLLRQMLAVFVFSVLGILVLFLAVWLMEKLTPFSMVKEIEEDHNTALAILVGALVIGISIIISAAMVG
ncbi:DUF350 domain-containing protein [Rubinisphaera margarita]|uniref:DUF350 domain-containing protein n=1 Tax=Rubinisphaera margarita TaxID=2909586 RepID=UPI001EE7B912|nr:DUF350 domain-containing protein [Rubinisphaera margarita]MCG6158293.1 DUF350 domain-containing protein [Rubinisphaera margarita]